MTVRSDERSVVLSPLRDFLRTESAGGVFLLAAAVVALVWANSPWQDSYAELWETVLRIDLGGRELSLDLRGWINEGLMTIFFFVVGLEIKRELVDGELREPRRAALPAIAAVGGMIVPALLFLAINAGGDASSGWAIPMATDIAIAVGVVSLLGARVSRRRSRSSCSPWRSSTTSAPSSSSPSSTPATSTSVRWRAAALVVAVEIGSPVAVHAVLAYRRARAGAVAGAARVGRPRHDRGCRPRAADADPADPPADLIDEDELTDLSSVDAVHRDRRQAVRLGGRVARAPAAPVDELRHRPAVRPGQRRRPDHRRCAVRCAVLVGDLRDRHRTRRRQAGRHHDVHVGGGAPRHRRAADRVPLGGGSSASARSPASASRSRCS